MARNQKQLSKDKFNKIPLFPQSEKKVNTTANKIKPKSIKEDNVLFSRKHCMLELMNFLPDATFAIDVNGIVIAWNKAMEELSGISAENILGKGNYEYSIPFYGIRRPILIDLVLHPKPQATKNYHVLSDKDNILIVETELANYVHGKAYIWAKASPLYDEQGNVIGAIESVRNITQHKKVELELENRVRERTKELQAMNQELEAFSYSVSHDLRSPVRSISGFSKILLDEYADTLDERGKDFLLRIQDSTQKLVQIIDDLLMLSRVTRSEIRHETVNMSQLALNIQNELETSDPKRKVNFNIMPNISVEGDPRLLFLALQNLIQNSWKFTSHHKTASIAFGVELVDQLPIYYVKDDGAGFDMTYSKKLFIPFQRLHSQSEFPGNGVGLAIVLRIIARHNGRIWCESEPEKGASFYFTLNERSA